MSSSTSTRGIVRELFKSGPAQIMRMDLDEEFAFKVIRLGEFIINLVTGAKASMSSCLLMCFSPCIQEHTIDTLARVFSKFGTYKDLNENKTGYAFPDNENKLQSLVFPVAEEELSRLGHILRMTSSSLRNQASGNLRMIHMSAATKMISNVLVSGFAMSKHIFIQETIPEDIRRLRFHSCV
ncbi:hypothetical protein M0R45_005103 [Rubus argutus]|uniref:Uncharacterized protein n=1 Tax=Rubus argutus TaxID=59490 RepID=A0AAW1YLR8_RUBAR